MTEELIERFAGHTPGPWEARSRTAFGDGEFAVETTHVEANDGKVVALTYGPDAEANSRLAAAAPDLLAETLALSARVAELEGVAADAVSGLRYIEHRYGRLEGLGWDRVFDAHDKLAALTKEAVVDG